MPGQKRTSSSKSVDPSRTQKTPGGSGPDCPLSGMLVLDFTRILGGPYCTKLLADLGAYVIKVEPPSGDHYRNRGPFKDGVSTLFLQLNRGKHSLCIDLKNPVGADLMRQLATKCDVLVENFRPGVMERLGLDYSTLKECNRKLVYCSISGFGSSGPLARRSAFAPIVHAYSGFDEAFGRYARNDMSINNPHLVADVAGGLTAFAAIQTALLSRCLRGTGDKIDVSLLEVMLSLQPFEVQAAQISPRQEQILYRALRTLDVSIVVAPTTQENFYALCAAIGREDMRDSDLYNNIRAREQNWNSLTDEIEAWTKLRSADDCEKILVAAGVPAAKYLSTEEILRHPHLAESRFFHKIDDRVGSHLEMGMPFCLGGLPSVKDERKCGLGAGNSDVLCGLLGISSEHFSALLSDRVVFDSESPP